MNDHDCLHRPTKRFGGIYPWLVFTQRRLDPGKETLEGFFQVGNQKEYQNVVIISFVHLEKIDIFCFMHKSVAQKLSLPCPFESQTLNSHKSANFKARDFSFWI